MHGGGGGVNCGIIFNDLEEIHTCTRCGQQLPNYADSDAFIRPLNWSLEPSLSKNASDSVVGVCEPVSGLGGPAQTKPHQPQRSPPGGGGITGAGGASVAAASSPAHHAPLTALHRTSGSIICTDTLERVCGNHHIHKSVEMCARTLLASTKYQDLRTRWKSGDEALCAYALYRACLQCSGARSLCSVAHWFDIPTAQLWKLDTKLEDYSELKVKPSDGLELARLYLDLSYTDTVKIGARADALVQEYTCSPSTMLAACLFNELGWTGRSNFFNRSAERSLLSLRQCATACGVSATSVGRLHKRIR